MQACYDMRIWQCSLYSAELQPEKRQDQVCSRLDAILCSSARSKQWMTVQLEKGLDEDRDQCI